MLKRIVIGVAVVLVVALGVGGWEAYRLYSGIDSLVSNPVPQYQLCTTPVPLGSAVPPSAAATGTVGVSGTPTAVPTPSPPAATGATHPRRKIRACDPVAASRNTLTGKKRINILLLGSDNDRKGIPLLSQTMMVVTIDPVHKKVGMLSIPRDFWVPIPNESTYGDITTYQKIDAAMSDGAALSGSSDPKARFAAGVALAELTVEQNFGIPIDYYAWVGLTGFVRVINTLHGVVVNAMHPIVDDSYPDDLSGGNPFAFTRVYIPAGPQYMNGWTALEYVRSRHADLVGDFGRGARQEQMLLGIRRKADALGLTDFQTIINLLNDLQGFVKSDIGPSQVLPMTNFARSLNPNAIHRLVLSPPLYSAIGTSPDGTQSIVTPNWPAIAPVVQRMFAPIGTGQGRNSGQHTHQPITAASALKGLLRIAGATPPPPPGSTAIVIVTSPIKGAIYFVADGNVWAFNGQGTTEITHTTAVDDEYLTANGRKLVFVRRWSPVVSDIYLLNRATARTQQLTHDRTTDGNVGDNLWAFNPVISPNGKTVVYSSDAYKLASSVVALTQNPDCGAAPANGGIDPALYTYDVSTGVSTQVSAPCLGAGGDTDPRFDPANPNLIVYTEFHYLQSDAIASRLVLLNLQTGQATRLTPFKGRNMQAAWQPNGRHMAYVGSGNQATTLYDAAFYGGRLHRSSVRQVDSGLISEPVFSPDGRQLAYFKLVGNDFQIWMVNLKNGWPVGRPMQLLTKGGLVASSPLVWLR